MTLVFCSVAAQQSAWCLYAKVWLLRDLWYSEQNLSLNLNFNLVRSVRGNPFVIVRTTSIWSWSSIWCQIEFRDRIWIWIWAHNLSLTPNLSTRTNYDAIQLSKRSWTEISVGSSHFRPERAKTRSIMSCSYAFKLYMKKGASQFDATEFLLCPCTYAWLGRVLTNVLSHMRMRIFPQTDQKFAFRSGILSSETRVAKYV